MAVATIGQDLKQGCSTNEEEDEEKKINLGEMNYWPNNGLTD